MTGQRLAVIGMGRSGIGVARAAKRRGALVTLYDQKLIETPEQLEQFEQLSGDGIEVIAGWHGRFEEASFDCLVASPGFARNHPSLRDAQKLGIEIISEIEFAARITDAPIIAVTGTNGKSTTVILTWLMVQSCTSAILCGNLSGSGYAELTLTEAADRAGEGDILVAEVSSFQLEWVHNFAPKVAAITNITPDHLDRHPSFEDYRDTKLRLFARQSLQDVAVVNVSDHTVPTTTTRAKIKQIGVRGTQVDSSYSPELLSLSGYGDVPVSELPLVGLHNVINAAMAWELASAALGDLADPGKMVAALKAFRGLANRMERIGDFRGVQIINNSMCTNPAAVIANSAGLGGRQILLMGGITKGLGFTPVKDYLAGTMHEVILFGPRQPGGLHDQLGNQWPEFPTLELATAEALRRARAAETVVLSPGCASAAPYANFRERGDAFRAIVQAYLQENHG